MVRVHTLRLSLIAEIIYLEEIAVVLSREMIIGKRMIQPAFQILNWINARRPLSRVPTFEYKWIVYP